MSEVEARAVGAGAEIQVGEKVYKLRPLVVRHLCELERKALEYYKRQYLSTYTQNLDLLPEDMRSRLLSEKLEEVARWDVGNLPQKRTWDVSRVPVNNELRDLLVDRIGLRPDDESGWRGALVTALEDGKVSAKEVRDLTGVAPRSTTVRYDQWWITSSMAGMVAFVTIAVQYEHPEVTEEEVARWPVEKLMEAANKTERLTVPEVGNT